MLTPLASVRLGADNELTEDVIGVMVENLSDALAAHPDWRILTEGKINDRVLASLIATFSALPEAAAEDEMSSSRQ